jgi:hypothetical protein
VLPEQIDVGFVQHHTVAGQQVVSQHTQIGQVSHRRGAVSLPDVRCFAMGLCEVSDQGQPVFPGDAGGLGQQVRCAQVGEWGSTAMVISGSFCQLSINRRV